LKYGLWLGSRKEKSRNNDNEPRCGANNQPIQPRKLLTLPVMVVLISHRLHPEVAQRILKLSASLKIFTRMQIEYVKDLKFFRILIELFEKPVKGVSKS
jgi:hypothetical protein